MSEGTVSTESSGCSCAAVALMVSGVREMGYRSGGLVTDWTECVRWS